MSHKVVLMKLPLPGTSSTIKTLKEQLNCYQMWFWEGIQNRTMWSIYLFGVEDSKSIPLEKQAIKEKSELPQLEAKTLSLPNTKQTTFTLLKESYALRDT